MQASGILLSPTRHHHSLQSSNSHDSTKTTSPISTKSPPFQDEESNTTSPLSQTSKESECSIQRSIQDVDRDIKAMDSLYSCNFGSWCKSQSHIPDTAKYLQRFVAVYSEEAVAAGLSWIIAGWSLRSSAELLLRAFSPWGVGHPMVARIIGKIMAEFTSVHAKLELVAAVVAFESAQNAAGFFRHLTERWHEDAIALYFEYFVRKLQWKAGYCEAFILEFCQISQNEFGGDWAESVPTMKRLFKEREQARIASSNQQDSQAKPEEWVKFYVKMMHRLAFATQKWLFMHQRKKC